MDVILTITHQSIQDLQMPHARDWQGGQMLRVQLELTDALAQGPEEFRVNK